MATTTRIVYNLKLATVLALLFITMLELGQGQQVYSCTYNNNNCTCDTNLGLIDLKPVSKGDPFQAKNVPLDQTYYWNPCKDFVQGGITAGAILESSGFYTDIGVHTNGFATVENGYAKFNMYSNDFMSQTYVTCICGSGNTLQFKSLSPYYQFDFTSDYCCPGYSPKGGGGSGISPGSILVIAFFAVLVLYLVVGVIFSVAVRKAQGQERIPNVTFWLSLPGLIRDGFIFVFTLGRRSGYQNM